MSSTSNHPTPPTAAPWRNLFTTHLSQTPNQQFTLSTVTLAPSNTPIPHARTCGFRGFFPEPTLSAPAIEALQNSGDGLNPAVYESDLLSFTTDARMEKINDLQMTNGAVEAVFWLKEVTNQWRVRGRAVVLGEPGCAEAEERRVWGHLRRKGLGDAGGDDEGQWGWERMVTTYFANHSPVMRGSFKAPQPGRPRSEAPSDPALKLGQKVDDIHDRVARRNFRVVVIIPEVVERLDVTDYENPGRWRWSIEDGDGSGDRAKAGKEGESRGRWVEVELWP